MKTNQNLVRDLNGLSVIQRTKDSFFNATLLIKQWNESKGQAKEVSKFMDLQGTRNFVESLIKVENLDTHNDAYVKSKASRGLNAGTWMHPYLFVKLAMWLSSDFEVAVIKFVYDNLIRFRIEGSDSYLKMNNAYNEWANRNYNKKLQQADYMKLANTIKSKVGVSDWNKASEKQSVKRKILEQVYEYAFNNNLTKKETNLMLRFELQR